MKAYQEHSVSTPTLLILTALTAATLIAEVLIERFRAAPEQEIVKMGFNLKDHLTGA